MKNSAGLLAIEDGEPVLKRPASMSATKDQQGINDKDDVMDTIADEIDEDDECVMKRPAKIMKRPAANGKADEIMNRPAANGKADDNITEGGSSNSRTSMKQRRPSSTHASRRRC